MEPQLVLVREQQKAIWNKFSAGWRTWDDFTTQFLKPTGDEIVNLLQLKDTDKVLDVAGGTGEPGLTIASIVKNGNVVITDLAKGMLDVTRDNARKKGIANYDTVACDVCELPFKDETFDAASCRFGFEFFPDTLMAAKEMVRVLKPGGKIAASVWSNPDKNFWITAMMNTIHNNMQLSISPPPAAAGMFRCGDHGYMVNLFKQTGLRNVVEKEITGKADYGDKDNYWNFMNDWSAPVVAAISKVGEAVKQKIKKEVFDLIDEKYPDGGVSLDYRALVVCGEK